MSLSNEGHLRRETNCAQAMVGRDQERGTVMMTHCHGGSDKWTYEVGFRIFETVLFLSEVEPWVEFYDFFETFLIVARERFTLTSLDLVDFLPICQIEAAENDAVVKTRKRCAIREIRNPDSAFYSLIEMAKMSHHLCNQLIRISKSETSRVNFCGTRDRGCAFPPMVWSNLTMWSWRIATRGMITRSGDSSIPIKERDKVGSVSIKSKLFQRKVGSMLLQNLKVENKWPFKTVVVPF